jgi:hypothetical protein
VLPFENLSGIPENAYFAERIQEEILTLLAKIADLKVIPRTSTTRYRSSPDNLRDIAKQLGVTNILEGSVQRTTDQVHVNVQLIKAASDAIPDIALVESDAVLAQQLAVFLLKGPSAMVLLLRLNILEHGIELTRAHRKRAIPALPEKAAIPSIKCFDPFRGCFLCLFDQLSLGNSSRQRRDNVNVISNTPDTHEFGTEVAADRGQISMHSRSNVAFQPGLAILGAKDDVEDDFTERLRHCVNDDRNCAGGESRFQRWRCGVPRILGRCPSRLG